MESELIKLCYSIEINHDLGFEDQIQWVRANYAKNFGFFGFFTPFLDDDAWVGFNPEAIQPINRKICYKLKNQELEKTWLFALVDFAIESLGLEETPVSNIRIAVHFAS